MTEVTEGDVQLYHRAGSLARPPWSLELLPADEGRLWPALKVLDLSSGSSWTFSTDEQEMLVLPLSGSCRVRCEHREEVLAGRASVFEGATDFAYLPPASTVTVSSDEGGRFALPGAKASRAFAFRRQPADATPVELRGAGSCSRRVVNYCMPGNFDADRLVACEVVTPGGNWSSYPPHKHDEATAEETELQEVYYFEVAPGPSANAGLAFQRVYGTPGRPLELLAEVRTGDVVLVPHGYHGPSMAAPGYDLYYLNVMAGPAERAWRFTDDPAHAWVRGTWAAQAVDPRLLVPGGPANRQGGTK
ncbi:MAG: 5-deoxy-glucuronate isomerase [Acidimicrobiales bacterium]